MQNYDEYVMELPRITQKVKEILLLAGVNMLKVSVKEGVGTYFEKRIDGKKYYFNYGIILRVRDLPVESVFNLVNYFMSMNGGLTIEFDFTKIVEASE